MLYDADSTRALKCPGCFTVAKQKRNSPPGRPSAAARGYGAEWRKLSEQVTKGKTHCPRCGEPYTTGNPATADHVIPKARGGTDELSNLVDCCRRCNSARGGGTRRKPVG